MLKKAIIVTLIFLLTFSLAACNKGGNASIKQKSDVNYEITKLNYLKSDDKLKCEIKYPQIIGLSDSDKEKKINGILKDEALKVLKYYENPYGSVELSIDYEIALNNPNILSIKYFGVGFASNAAHPNNIYYTTNIDIDKGAKIKLIDIININESFIQKFKEGKYTVFYSELNIKNESKNEVDKYFKSELIEYFNKADDINKENELSAFSYFTNDSLGISISVPHAIGDHAEFEIKYRGLKDYLKSENKIWKDLLH